MTLAQVDALARGQQRRATRPAVPEPPAAGAGDDLAMWARMGVPIERVVSDG